MAAIDPVAYLRATPPFDALPQALFDQAAHALEVSFYPTGARIVRAGGAPLEHLYVIRKGAVRLERDGQELQVLEEGETFGYTSLITGEATFDVVVEEDLVAYRLPAAEFRRLLGSAQFAGHFASGLGQRLKSSLDHSPVATFQTDLTLEVQQLARRAPVWVDASATVGDAARVMRDERISSVLVRSDPPGIVTDRDFRNRVLADRLGPETPVTRILSSPLRTVPGDTPTYDAWRTLLDAGVHHLPITRGGEIVGLLTATDLLRVSALGPVAVLRRVERISRDGLAGYSSWIAEMTAALLAGGLDVTVIAGFVARLNDTLLRRLLGWAEAELGAPPAPYAWIAFGSEGRMEQTLLTDQDNALVFADRGAPQRAWFEALAERVNSDLEAAGFPDCPGGYMARRWSGTLSEWVTRFHDWIDAPTPQALLQSSIFFDFRRVGGQLELDPLEELIATSVGKPAFLRFLARTALAFRPPQALLLRLRGSSSTFDLKAQGISPIVFLARCYGLEAGVQARNTLARLEAAVRAGHMAEDNWVLVGDAYKFLLGLRLRLQLRAVARGDTPTNKASLAELTALERTRLKEAFRAVRSWQQSAAYHYQADF
jgi:CBS domain-containing protein